HLRMLRAVRFAARFGFEIEPATLAAIQKLHAQILRVSPERIRDELVRILTEGGVWTHTLIMLDGLRAPSPALALGVLLHDVGKPGTFRVADRIRFDGHVELGERIAREILNRLRFSNAEIDQVIALIANHM